MSLIHPLAHVDKRARIGRDVTIGPFCHVDAGVELGDGCTLSSHVTLLGPAVFGARNQFYPFCTLGAAPQDLKFRNGPTSVAVGDDNIFRENVTMHRGTEVCKLSNGVTRVGSRNLLMVGVHVAHDCDIRDHVIIANSVQIAGHVRIEECVNIGGASALHHFVTVGRNSFIGGMTRVTHDVPPFMKVQGYDQEVRGVNSTGMRRWQISDDSINAVKHAFRLIYSRRGERSPGRTAEALRELEQHDLIRNEHVRYLVYFLRRKMEIGIFGRVREHLRSDTDADRAWYYQPGAEAGASRTDD